MDIDEYHSLDAVAIDALVADGQVAAESIRDAATAAHEEVHEAINAVVEWYENPIAAIEREEPAPALRGVPLLRKDYGSAEAGRLVEMGSRMALGHRATETAPYVRRLLDAGVQILGRSAVPEFIQHGVTESRVHGATRNPWDRSISAGGSSGGAAAAVAAGVVPVAHASDCAGSIRIPAATCGLVGLKPGRQRVPWDADWDGIAQEFVVCRSVRDARRCLDVLGVGDYSPIAPKVRVALSTNHWAGCAPDPSVVAATEGIAMLLESLGHEVEPIDQPVDYPTIMQSWPTEFNRFALQDAQRLAALTGRPIDNTTLEPMTLAVIDHVRSLSPSERESSRAARRTAVERLESSLADYDVILTPTLGRATVALNTVGGEVSFDDYEQRNDENFPYSYLFNLSGWPSISVPAKPDAAGHPIGAQLSAPIGHEHTLLNLAAEIEAAQPWPLVAPPNRLAQ